MRRRRSFVRERVYRRFTSPTLSYAWAHYSICCPIPPVMYYLGQTRVIVAWSPHVMMTPLKFPWPCRVVMRNHYQITDRRN